MSHDDSESVCIQKGPCAACGSSDGNAEYSDGHSFCFVCNHHTPADGATSTRKTAKVPKDFDPIHGEYRALGKRGLTEDTCKHFGYQVGERYDSPVQIANYYKDGELVAQHFRDSNKNFAWSGTPRGCELFGQHLWRDGGRKVVITEGEIDCMSLSQLQGNKYPVVSIPSGAAAAEKDLRANIEWLEKFEEVVLMFDMDAAGKAAIEKCAPLFTPGRCKVASLPLKDANEMLMAGRAKELIDAVWGAKEYRPDGVVSVGDLMEKVMTQQVEGTPWFLPSLTAMTYGRRPGEVYAFGAGTGVGKTDLFTQSIAFDVLNLKVKTGVLYLEQPPVETIRRIAGKAVGKVFHVPGKATREDLQTAAQSLEDSGSLYLYDHFGSTEWDLIKSRIRYMVVGLGCKHIYLDHLTALVASEEDERRSLDAIMAEMAGQAQELGYVMHFISHLARPEGKPHEEGGRVMIRHFRGSNAIGMWSHLMVGLERSQQDDDEAARCITTLRCLKDRNTGQATGKTIRLRYDSETGLLSEAGEPDSPFGPVQAGSASDAF
ncbi:toprim domain-containing protein [Variovorax sp. RKNM96]|uniref:toprim domain-containing protein n=1 Tax=Variovorax sp. RKNM96 TaxID=2681552 RepID=UPI00197EC9CF|nr:toprim domain-containing protein [Variovorax sp. RKNM96]QSI31459.1 toprim domain-containing protein [Variovorax sp. RKNM96]